MTKLFEVTRLERPRDFQSLTEMAKERREFSWESLRASQPLHGVYRVESPTPTPTGGYAAPPFVR
jgi:hypothetical protein